MRRRVIWTLGSVAVVIGALSALKASRDSQRLTLLYSPVPVELIQSEDIDVKPSINVNLPWFGRIIWPKPSPIPLSTRPRGGGGIDPGLTAGVLVPDIAVLPAWMGRSKQWRIGDAVGCYPLFENRLVPYISCPRIFGTKPRTAEVKVISMGRLQGRELTFSVRLPALGKPAPKLSEHRLRVGSWNLTVTPLPWLAPAFCIQYAVRIDDGKGSTFRVDASWEAASVPDSTVRCAPGEPGILLADVAEPSTGTPNNRVTLRITRLIPTPARFTVHWSDGGNVQTASISEAKKRSSVKISVSPQSRSMTSSGCPMKIGPDWFNWNWLPERTMDEGDTVVTLKKYKDGQVVDGFIFEDDDQQEVPLKLDAPDISVYR